MFEYLQQIDYDLYSRYLTVEKNVKSASNSFYDSFLDLQEHFLRTVAGKKSIVVDPHESCGALLNNSGVKELFLNGYGLDPRVYDKMGDYAKKVNEHKHRKEKTVEADTIVNYMRVFYAVSSSYAQAEGLAVPQFNGRYFKDIYGSMANIAERLNGVEAGQQELIDAVNKLTREKQTGQAEVNKRQNGGQTLGSFIVNAEKKYDWFGTEKDFKKHKTVLICIQASLIAVGILSTVISSLCFNFYSTFTLFENIVLAQAVILLIYTLKTEKRYLDSRLAKYNSNIFVLDSYCVWRDDKEEKKRYKYFRIISYAAVVCNTACIWVLGNGAVRITAIVFELAFLGLTIASVIVKNRFYGRYSDIFISGLNASGTPVTIVYDRVQNKLITLEEYKEKYDYFN